MRVKEFLTQNVEQTINDWLENNEDEFDMIDFKVIPDGVWIRLYIVYEEKCNKVSHLPSLDLPKDEFRKQIFRCTT